MSVTTITLPRTGTSPLRFTGQLVAEADNETIENNRWYQIRVYSTGAKYVVHVGFRTRWESERDHDVVEVVDVSAKVADVLQQYDVLPENRGYPPTPVFAERQARLRNALQRDYGLLVSKILSDDLFVESVTNVSSGDDPAYQEADRRVVESFVEAELHAMSFSRNEALVVCEANSTFKAPCSPWEELASNVLEHPELDEKWGVDGPRLVRRLRVCSRGELFAISMAVMRYWRLSDRSSEDALKFAGFVIRD